MEHIFVALMFAASRSQVFEDHGDNYNNPAQYKANISADIFKRSFQDCLE